MTPREQYNEFVNVIINTVKECTPKTKKKLNVYKKSNLVPRWDNECDKLKRLRRAHFKKWEN